MAPDADKPKRLAADNPLLRAILDAMPSAVFLVNRDLEIQDFNRAAEDLAPAGLTDMQTKLCGEALSCLRHTESQDGCGTTEHCEECVIRDTMTGAIQGERAVRRREVMHLHLAPKTSRAPLLVTAAPFEYEGERFALLVLEDLADLLKRGELLTICANCKKIRLDRERWESLEGYFSVRSGLQFSHGVCPGCYEEFYGED